MTVNINIEPEIEARLVARAGSSGQSLEGFIHRLLEREVAETETSGVAVMTGAQKAKAFRVWAESFPASLPVLSLDSISRENIYRRD